MEVPEPRVDKDEALGGRCNGHCLATDGGMGVGVVGGNKDPEGVERLTRLGLARGALSQVVQEPEDVVSREQPWVSEQNVVGAP